MRKLRQVNVNDRMAEILGYSADEMLGLSMYDFMDDESRLEAERSFQKRRDGIKERQDFRFRRKDGTDLWAIVSSSPIMNDQDVFMGAVGLVTDITDRKLTEEALRDSERRFRELVEMLPIAVYSCDLSGAIESYNQSAVEMWGRAPQLMDIADNFRGSYKIYSIDGVYLPHAECPMAQGLRTGKPISNEEIVVERPDGARRTAMVNVLPRRDERGKMTGAINCLVDITDRKQAEERVRDSEAKFRAITQTAHDAIVVCDSRGNIVFWNSGASEIFGYTEQESLSLPMTQIMPEMYREAYQKGLERLRAGGEPHLMGITLALRGLRKTGDEFPLELTLSNYKTNDETFYSGIIRDTTERSRAEERLRKSERQLTRAQEITHLGSWDWDMVTNELKWSDELYRIYGFEPQAFEITYEISINAIHPDDREFVASVIRKSIEQGKLFRFEHRIIRPDESIRFVEGFGEPIFDEQDKFVKMVGTRQDITERKLAENAVKQSEQDYRAFFEQAHDAIIVFNPEHEIVLDVNERACQLYGFSRDEFTGLSLETISKNQANGAENVSNTLAAGKNYGFESVQKCEDGSEMYLEINASTVDYQGQQAIISINRDITDRKQAEEKLARSENELRTLFSAMSDVILELDSDGRYVKIAPTNPGLLYKPAEDIIGKTMHEVFPAEVADMFLDYIKKALASEQPINVEYSLPIKGEEKTFSATSTKMTENSVLWVSA